jgi:type I restriction enzyme S subunit
MTTRTRPTFIPSGIDWLPEVPADWRVGKFRHHFTESSEVNGAMPVGVMLSVSGYRGVEVKKYDDENRRRLDEDLETYRVVRPGQLAVNTMWLNHAGLGVSDVEGHMSPAYRAYTIDPGLNQRYAHHLLRSSIYVNAYTGHLTGVRPNSLQMSRNTLMGWPILIPPMPEQREIAEYLDRETGKLDTLIAKQEQLVATLTERRQAVITSATTRGLHPDSDLVDSDDAVLGSIPDGWAVKRLGDGIVGVSSGRSVNAADRPATEAEFGVLKTSSVSSGAFRPEENKVVVDEERSLVTCSVVAGALLVNRANSPEYVGAAALVQRSRTNLFLSDKIWSIAFSASFSPAFVWWWTQTRKYRDQVGFGIVGASASMQNLSVDQFRQIRIALPQIDEQIAIVGYLDRTTSSIDLLRNSARAAALLLQERRQALISAAVTGKIDVRGL